MNDKNKKIPLQNHQLDWIKKEKQNIKKIIASLESRIEELTAIELEIKAPLKGE